MEILSKILGNPGRVKVMRLFLLNKGNNFTAKEVAKRSRINASLARRELKMLSAVRFLKKKGDKWFFNPAFSYGEEFEDLLVRADSLEKDSILNQFKKLGRLKLVIISGIFIKNKESGVDLLIVGDRLKKGKIEEGIKKIEAELGAELVYALFDTKEFLYRLDMYDKLVRDILDYPHETLLESKELSTYSLKKA